MEGVFQGMCVILKRMVPCDRAALSVYDPDQDGLKIVDVYGPRSSSIFYVGQLLSRKTSQSGWAFEHQKTIVRGDLAKEFRFSTDKAAVDEGYLSACSVPLIVRGNSIGAVTIAAGRKNRLSINHAAIVEEVSKQIALAISCSMLRCPIHTQTKLVCPRCIGASGGKTTASKHREDLSIWGRKGGRGRRNVNLVE
jgi:formate hydrogenlyase transcriptional activator